MSLVGELSTWVALLMAAWAMVASFGGSTLSRSDLTVSGRRALYATFGFSVVAAAGMWSALLGSTLFWCALFTGVASAFLIFDRGARRRVTPAMTGLFGVVALALLVAICFGADPYVRLGATDGSAAAGSTVSGTVPLVIGTLLALAGMTLVLGPLLSEPIPLSPRQSVRMTERVTDPVEAAIQRARETQKACETCGPRPEPDAVFCSTCGSYLPGACASCGVKVETSASSYCGHCGHQLAA